MTPVYTAEATANAGGRAHGHVETSDGKVKVDTAFPREMGGDGKGTNPEQLVSMGYAACFSGAIGAIAKKHGADLEGLSVTVRTTFNREDDGGFALSFEVQATLPKMTQEAADALVADAHTVCPYSRAFQHTAPTVAKAIGGA